MKLLNYVKPMGRFTNANQLIAISLDTKDRQEKKMLEEAQELVAKRIERAVAYSIEKAAKAGEDFDEAAERAALTPLVEDGQVFMPLQYLQEYMTRKMAAIQNNVSIHNTKDVGELVSVFNDFGVELISELKGLIFDHIGWSARPGQKPKLMVHAKEADDTPVVIRFEAASELCQKFLNSAITFKLKPGTVFDLAVEAVDPAIEKNKRAGKKVSDLGVYVNHNLSLTVAGEVQTGHPPKGTRFLQKPTLEQLEILFRQARNETSV